MSDQDESEKGVSIEGVAKGTVSAVGELIKIAKDDPQAKEAAKNLGKAAVTITKTINVVLLPLAAVNSGFEKARLYFEERFQKDMEKETSGIPADQVVEPKASIAGPALQGLAFSHEEAELKAMYLSLLATSMDQRVSTQAHPAYVEVIKQLSAAETILLRAILTSSGLFPIAELRSELVPTKNGFHVLTRHVMNIVSNTAGQPEAVPGLEAMVDNWTRLGLTDVDYVNFLLPTEGNPDKYKWVEQRPEFLEAKANSSFQNENRNVVFQRGRIASTAFGRAFAKAVGMASEI